MRDVLEQLLRAADVPSPERAELLWSEYRADGPGAEAAFTTLLAWYGLGIYRRIWGFVRSDEAEDVFQDVLARLHRQRRYLATFEQALRWLRTVAVRACVDAHRRATRRKAREAKASRPEEEAPAGERNELQEALAVALSKLPREHGEAVALVFFEGLDKKDAAKVLGINRDTLADRLNVALSRLRKLVPVLAAAAVAEPSELSAGPLPSAARLNELAKAAWAQTAAGGPATGKLVATALVVLAGFGGVTWAAWPRPEPEPPAVVAVTPAPPPPVESVPDRNLRIFRDEVLPRQLAALRPLAGEGGEFELEYLSAYDTRVDCGYVHRPGKASPPVLLSRIWFTHNTTVHRTEVVVELAGLGRRRIDPERPLILGRNPFTGREVVFRSVALDDAIRAFRRLPQDDRTAAEAHEHRRRVASELARFLGTWYIRGDASRPCLIFLSPTEDGVTVKLPDVQDARPLDSLRVDVSGWVAGLPGLDRSARVTVDGRQIQFDKSDDWWAREPMTAPGKQPTR